ncbi:MAG: response regulator [Thermodesulfobacteriota bacterium]|nr:response regulator [Thermodesulfobacteriota bacterium]
MKNKLKILIVEDEKDCREMLEELLTSSGFIVEAAKDGTEGIIRLEKEEYDLVITDLMMPQVNGIDVLRTAKKINPHAQVIIVTGFASLETALQAIKEGAYDYIMKPFKLEEVVKAVNNASEKVLLLLENADLIENLKKRHKELQELRKTKVRLYREIDVIDEKMEEGQKKIDTGLVTLKTIYGGLLPHHYTLSSNDNKEKMLDELSKLGKLKDEGILSEEEFKIYKEKLLSKILN